MVNILIIGLDALDPILVNKWKLNWFKQKFWGKHYVGFFKTEYTPIIWSSFLTGTNVEELGFDLDSIKNMRTRKMFKNTLLYYLYLIRKRLPVKRLGLRQLLIKANLIDRYIPENMPEELLSKTFLDELRREGYKVVGIEIPGYNEKKNIEYRFDLPNYLSKPLKERNIFIEQILKDISLRIQTAINYVKEEYNLVFVYSPLPDEAFHLVDKINIQTLLWLRRIHYKLYKTIKPLIEQAIENEYVILILSDHGFDLKKHDHSDYGFWSLNIYPPEWWSIKTILDFKENIIKLLKETH